MVDPALVVPLIADTATTGGALLAAPAALAVAYLNPSVTSLRIRHQQVDKLFDEALSNLSLIQAARHLATGVPAAMHGRTPDQQRDFEIRLRERGIERFDERMMNAKASLGALTPYVPEAHGWITAGWEIAEADEPDIRRILGTPRSQAVRTERLWRQRRRSS